MFAKSLGELIPASFLTTKTAPPLATPAIIFRSLPFDAIYPLIAGFGPTYVCSILFANNASMAEGPALNTVVSILYHPYLILFGNLRFQLQLQLEHDLD